MNVSTPVPDVGTPVFDANGYINPVWHQFFFTLLRRTGSEEGVDAVAEGKRITRNTIRIDENEAVAAGSVPVWPPAQPSAPSAEVYTHGLHYDPTLHALVTPQLAGFMSPEDKAKLDSLYGLESGTWTPSLTFAVPGDLSVAYSQQIGTYKKFGSLIILSFQVTTTNFTYSNSSGVLSIVGVPFANVASQLFVGTMSFQGLDRAGFTQFDPVLPESATAIRIYESGPGKTRIVSDTGTTTSGVNVSLFGTIIYQT